MAVPLTRGGLAHASLEAGYDLRTRSGFSLVLGLGPAFVLGDDTQTRVRSCGFFCGNARAFRSGDVAVHSTLELGWAF